MVDFVKYEVLNGLQRLYALRLISAPAQDTLQATALVWIDIITKLPINWNDSDKGRITKAFDLLIVRVDKWPSPKQLIDLLPARKPEPLMLMRKLSEEEVQHNRMRIRELRDQLRNLGENNESSDTTTSDAPSNT